MELHHQKFQRRIKWGRGGLFLVQELREGRRNEREVRSKMSIGGALGAAVAGSVSIKILNSGRKKRKKTKQKKRKKKRKYKKK